jgi:uncharacterized protein (DUF2141 family)
LDGIQRAGSPLPGIRDLDAGFPRHHQPAQRRRERGNLWLCFRAEALLEPALRAAEAFLPRNLTRQIEGIPARRGIVYADLYNSREGTLRAVPGLERPPFEITLATPRAASVHLQMEALHAALTAILTEFRRLQAIGQNI